MISKSWSSDSSPIVPSITRTSSGVFAMYAMRGWFRFRFPVEKDEAGGDHDARTGRCRRVGADRAGREAPSELPRETGKDGHPPPAETLGHWTAVRRSVCLLGDLLFVGGVIHELGHGGGVVHSHLDQPAGAVGVIGEELDVP